MQTNALLKELFQSALDGIDPRKIVSEYCFLKGSTLSVHGDSYELSSYEKVYVLGSGKAAWSMAAGAEKLLGDFVHSGLVVSPLCTEELKKITCLESDHPIPTQRSIEGGEALAKMMQGCTKRDLFIFLLSGGSSALVELPVEGISLEDLQEATDIMLKHALSIDEINVIRKHLSRLKGGRLGAMNEAQGLVLTISDVIGDDLYSIGSAPLYADRSSFSDAMDILRKYEILEQMPKGVCNALKEGSEHLRLETPKQPCESIRHYILASNDLAKEAVRKRALSLGEEARVIKEAFCKDVKTAAEKIIDTAYSSPEKIIVFGGETTVRVTGKGRGGRNQQLVLLMLKLAIEKGLRFSFLSAGTDGIDGNSDAAGAFFDARSLKEHKQRINDIDAYLLNNDAYHFFKPLDSLLMTGPTGTNVMDIAILIKEF